MNKIIPNLIRFAGEGALLWVVWHNSHWSVALVLSLLTTGFEVSGFVLHFHGEQIRAAKRLKRLKDILD